MSIHRTMVTIVETGEVSTCDTITYDGGLWLVSEWIEVPTDGYKEPARLIRIDKLRHRKIAGEKFPATFLLNVPLPKALFNAVVPTDLLAKFEVVDLPGILYPIQRLPYQ